MSPREKRRISSQPHTPSMAEKISMIIVLVDLDCHKCYNKIRKILCQLQDCERIRTISFDDTSKTITIVGPIDPLRLACKLRCRGGKVIRDINIVEMAKPQQQEKHGKQKHTEKSPGADEQTAPERERKQPHHEMLSCPKVKERSPPRLPARPCKQPPVEYVIPTVEIPSLPRRCPVGPCGCPCCAPCYQGYYEVCRCCCCGRAYGLAPAECGYRGCRTFRDEDPTAACTVM